MKYTILFAVFATLAVATSVSTSEAVTKDVAEFAEIATAVRTSKYGYENKKPAAGEKKHMARAAWMKRRALRKKNRAARRKSEAKMTPAARKKLRALRMKNRTTRKKRRAARRNNRKMKAANGKKNYSVAGQQVGTVKDSKIDTAARTVKYRHESKKHAARKALRKKRRGGRKNTRAASKAKRALRKKRRAARNNRRAAAKKKRAQVNKKRSTGTYAHRKW